MLVLSWTLICCCRQRSGIGSVSLSCVMLRFCRPWRAFLVWKDRDSAIRPRSWRGCGKLFFLTSFMTSFPALPSTLCVACCFSALYNYIVLIIIWVQCDSTPFNLSVMKQCYSKTRKTVWESNSHLHSVGCCTVLFLFGFLLMLYILMPNFCWFSILSLENFAHTVRAVTAGLPFIALAEQAYDCLFVYAQDCSQS